jgi:tryptophan halogenase
MSEGAPIRRIVIVGGGTAGWMAAAALARFVGGSGRRIVLVESEAIGTVGVGEGTIPPILEFNHQLGLDEAEYLRATHATYKLGIEFVGWTEPGQRYFHQFGEIGRPLNGVSFHQVWLKYRGNPAVGPLAAYSMSAVAAANGRFAHSSKNPDEPLSEIAYAFHFDASAYGQYLRRFAEKHGAERIEGRIVDVEQDGETGFVTALKLDDDRQVRGDLFIDCSGFRSLLLGDKLGVAFEDWSRWLPCDRAVAVPTPLTGPPEPYVRCTARPAGWQWRIPLQHRMGNGLVYSSPHLSRHEAEELLLANLEAEPLAPARHLSFTAGRRRLAWSGNVVSLGLSSGFVEPLESTSIHLIQSGIAKLLALFPDRRFNPVERDEYNRQMQEVFEDVRDFIILHYKVTRRDDSDLWNYCRTMEVPGSLAGKLDLWRAKGRLFRQGRELFGTASWVAVLLGQGLVPDEQEPAANAMDSAFMSSAIDQMRLSYRRTAEQMPSHAEYIARHCRAAAP